MMNTSSSRYALIIQGRMRIENRCIHRILIVLSYHTISIVFHRIAIITPKSLAWVIHTPTKWLFTSNFPPICSGSFIENLIHKHLQKFLQFLVWFHIFFHLRYLLFAGWFIENISLFVMQMPTKETISAVTTGEDKRAVITMGTISRPWTKC